MESYERYGVEDFVLDEAFRKWVLHPDKSSHSFWTNWLAAHPQKAATVAQAIELIRQLPVVHHGISLMELSNITEAIEAGIDNLQQTDVLQEKVVPLTAYAIAENKESDYQPRFLFVLAKIAACVLFVIGMAYFIYQYKYPESPAPGVVYEQVVKESPIGQKTTVFLSDGSKVMLNAGSRLTFTKPFQPDKRGVNLEGEAFFEVARDSLRPFQVFANEVTTTALGTSFNIAAYPESNDMKISLAMGKVKVSYQSQTDQAVPETYFLVPGEKLLFETDKKLFTKQLFNADEVLAWKEGIIYLKNADQPTVIKTLERWYGVRIEIEGNSTTSWDISAKFDNQSLKSVLTSLAYTLNFDFVIKEDHVLIKYL